MSNKKLINENIKSSTRGFAKEKELEDTLKLEIAKEISNFNQSKNK